MACGIPIVASAKGETTKIIHEAKCGICAKINDEKALAIAISKIMSANIVKMSENAKQYYETHYEKNFLMDEMEKFLIPKVS